MKNSLYFLFFANELLRNSQLNFIFSIIVLAICVLRFVCIKWKCSQHFDLQWASFIVLKSDHLKVYFLYRSSIHSVLLLWTLATRDVTLYFCHSLTPICTIHNSRHLDSHSANFLSNLILRFQDVKYLNSGHKFSSISNISAAPYEL